MVFFTDFNVMKGRSKSDSHKKNISKSKRGVLNPASKGSVVTPFGTFKSSRDAAKSSNISQSTICAKCRTLKIKDWFYEIF